jgi:hypothetical protein
MLKTKLEIKNLAVNENMELSQLSLKNQDKVEILQGH